MSYWSLTGPAKRYWIASNRIPGIAIEGSLLAAYSPAGPASGGVIGAIAHITENVLQIGTDRGKTAGLGGNLLVV